MNLFPAHDRAGDSAMTQYKLEIYGDERIEDSTETFDFLGKAVDEVEKNITDDNDGWKFEDGKLRLVDYNHGAGAVIHRITMV